MYIVGKTKENIPTPTLTFSRNAHSGKDSELREKKQNAVIQCDYESGGLLPFVDGYAAG